MKYLKSFLLAAAAVGSLAHADNCELGIHESDMPQYGVEEMKALHDRGYSVSVIREDNITLADLAKPTLIIATSTSQWLFWTVTEYTVHVGRTVGNSMHLTREGRGGTLKDALASMSACGE